MKTTASGKPAQILCQNSSGYVKALDEGARLLEIAFGNILTHHNIRDFYHLCDVVDAMLLRYGHLDEKERCLTLRGPGPVFLLSPKELNILNDLLNQARLLLDILRLHE
jgi:hypothetical protein